MADSIDHESAIPVVKFAFVHIVANLLGAEGPVFDTNGTFYMVAAEVEKNSLPAGQVVQVNLETNKTHVVSEPEVDGYGGIPAGCQSDHDNNIFIADMRLGLIKMSPDGTIEQLARKDSDGNTIQGCNDLIFDYNGDLWITAPAGNIAPDNYTRSMQEPFGSLYCYTRDKRIVKVDTGIQFPNGIAVQHGPDGKPQKLIVAETPTKTLWSYDILGPGKLANKTKWATVPGDHVGGADGLDFDIDNNLLVANWGSSHIEVYGPDGGLPIKRIKCPFQRPSNLHFQPGNNTVYVTEHDNYGLWKFEWERIGKPHFCELPRKC